MTGCTVIWQLVSVRNRRTWLRVSGPTPSKRATRRLVPACRSRVAACFLAEVDVRGTTCGRSLPRSTQLAG